MFSPVELNLVLTKEILGYNTSELVSGSHKKVIVNCLGCGKSIYREFRDVKKLHRCSVVEGNNKRCFRCKKWKNLTLFNKNPNGSGGVAKMCRDCYNSHPSVIKAEKDRCKRKSEAFANGNIKYYINNRVVSIKNNAKKRFIKFNIDSNFMYKLWEKQCGLCYYTGIPMQSKYKQPRFQAWDSPSVDRKNPVLGYTKGNVVWCISGVNSFKQSFTESQFKKVIQEIRWWK